MPYSRNKKSLFKEACSVIVTFLAVSFWGASFSAASDWSCTPPPTEAIKLSIDEYPGPNHSFSSDNQIAVFVGNSIEKRRNFRERIAVCNGNKCSFSPEFIDFIGNSISLPREPVEMSICSSHGENCFGKYCSTDFPEVYHVLYKWNGGLLGLGLELSRTLSDQIDVDEFIEDNTTFDPRIRDSYFRVVGVSHSSRLSVTIREYE